VDQANVSWWSTLLNFISLTTIARNCPAHILTICFTPDFVFFKGYFSKCTRDRLQKLHAIFRRATCVFCRFRKDRDLVGTQLHRLDALKHSHKSVIEKCNGFGLHGPKN